MAKLRRILGSMNYGGSMDELQSHSTLRSFLSRGYTEVDTAIVYQGGKTEEILGNFEDCRDPTKVKLACKVNPNRGFERNEVVNQLNTSLNTLKVPSVDILYLHGPNHKTPIEDTLSGIDDLYKEGKFKEFGISNYSAWQTADIYHICKENGYVLPSLYQGMYNPITRDIEGELIPMLRRYNMRLYIYNPLAGGMLSGKYNIYDDNSKQPIGRFFAESSSSQWKTMQSGNYQRRFWREPYKTAVKMVDETIQQHNKTNSKISLYEASFRWIVNHSKLIDDDGIILGFSKPEQLESNLNAMVCDPLPKTIVDVFDEAWNMIGSKCPKYYR